MMRPFGWFARYARSQSVSLRMLSGCSRISFSRFYSSGVSTIQASTDTFIQRQIGTTEIEQKSMLRGMGYDTLDSLIYEVMPKNIRTVKKDLPTPMGEFQALNRLRDIAKKNEVVKSFIGMGYHDTITPPVLRRNVLENPAWYTAYTPYQPEISQGRLEVAMIYQTMVSDLTGLEVANSSLLDEATAAAEAIMMCYHHRPSYMETRKHVFVSALCHPQVLAVIQTRFSRFSNVRVHMGTSVMEVVARENLDVTDFACAVFQYPGTDGRIDANLGKHMECLQNHGIFCVVGSDLLSLTLLQPPGRLGADICFGTTQRFGIPLGFGGPHAAYIACKAVMTRSMPGRIIGISKDRNDQVAYRMALQTREQHIKRERATSNICTAQALLANTSALYAAYHGPQGLSRIANKIHRMALVLTAAVKQLNCDVNPHETEIFDTVSVRFDDVPVAEKVVRAALKRRMNIRRLDAHSVTIALDECTTVDHVDQLIEALCDGLQVPQTFAASEMDASLGDDVVHFSETTRRADPYLQHPVFREHQSETEMLRYIHSLSRKDYGLQDGMIALGSCTMKLNAAAETEPITWHELANVHPFVPGDQSEGYMVLIEELEHWLCEITGFSGCTLQPNAGSQGEFAGLLMFRAYHDSIGQGQRNVCLIPTSAHGTNAASAAIAGMNIQYVACDSKGNVDVAHLQKKVSEHAENLSCIMITYPSTHGVFESQITEIVNIVHERGGQVYMDGANMNAQIGLTNPATIGADCCHLNVHKTFALAHGGGGPGLGPVCVANHLVPFLPTHPVVKPNGASSNDEKSIGTIAGAPWSSASLFAIPWMYCNLLGSSGLRRCSEVAILHANYMKTQLEKTFDVLYTNPDGTVGHEFILDMRGFQKRSAVDATDIAKRLQDYGFHPPTVSFPVKNTMMIEPTESEPLHEMDRFVEALKSIKKEIEEIEAGCYDTENNVLKLAPHTMALCTATEWNRPYTREKACFPTAGLRERKFWPSNSRVDEIYGDKHPKFKLTVSADVPTVK